LDFPWNKLDPNLLPPQMIVKAREDFGSIILEKYGSLHIGQLVP
jgi:hypothetical protein